MVQIIGLMLCLYLVVKGLEAQQRQRLSTRDDGRGSVYASLITLLCFLGAVAFGFLLIVQGSRFPSTY